MSAVVDFVDDVVAGLPVISVVWDQIKYAADTLWQEVASPVIEFAFSLLGIEDEDVLNGDVLSQRVMKDDSLGNIPLDAALRWQHNDKPILSTIAASYAEIRAKYNSYNNGSSYYIDGIPEASIRARTVDTVVIKEVLDNINGEDNTVVSAAMKVPDKYEWVMYQLQESNGYIPYLNQLSYGGYDDWHMVEVLYDYVEDIYNVEIRRYQEVTVNTYERTAISVVNVDETTDEVTTETYERVETIKEFDGTDIINTLVSTVTEQVTVGSVTESDISVLVDTVSYSEVYATEYLDVVSYTPSQVYVIKYEWVIDEWYYWIYDTSTGEYPTIDESNKYATGLEMLPIVALKNNSVYVDSVEDERYSTSKRILNTIGLDIDTMIDGIRDGENSEQVKDAFIHFGINPHDTSEIISKVMYRMANTIFNDSSLLEVITTEGDESSVYSFNINEGSFNQMAKWDIQSREIKTGSIGAVGKHNHEVVGASLYIRKQETESEYVEYKFENVTSMTWINYGGQGTLITTDINNERAIEGKSFYIPLSMEFVRQLSAREQKELFVKTLIVSLYAAEIVHLEYYETKAFGVFMEFVAIVIFLIIFNPASLKAWAILAATIAATYALKKVLESGASDWIKVIAAIAYITAGVVYGGGENPSTLMTAVQATSLTATSVTMYTAAEMKRLEKQQQSVMLAYKKKFEELEEKQASLEGTMVTSEYVSDLITVSRPSTSRFYDIAKGSIQYNYDILYKLDVMYNYDNKFKLGSY